MATTDFAAAALKGLIEHNDAGSYFGSTMALNSYLNLAQDRGWVTEDNKAVTEAGHKHYNESGLADFPKIPNRRAYFWDWSAYKGGENE